MYVSLWSGPWEVFIQHPSVSGLQRQGVPEPMTGMKKSDSLIVVMKPPNKGASAPAEVAERSGLTKGSPKSQSTHRTQGRTRVKQATQGVRSAFAERYNLR